MAAMVSLVPPEVVRDSDVWFEDGNVVAIAQQTAFRFHKGALSRQSVIFCDLFSVPQPQPANQEASIQHMDGCPVVHVSDTAYDFKHLLRAVYDGTRCVCWCTLCMMVVSDTFVIWSSVFPGAGPMEFGVIASIVRMGHKYQVDTILEEGLRRLRTIFTSDFATWDIHQGKSNGIVTVRPEDAIEAVNLAQLTGHTEMLSSAFYMCGQLEVDTLIAGVARADGTLERLSTYDLQRCLSGQIMLVKHDAQCMAEVFYADASPNCFCPLLKGRHEYLLSRYADLLPELPDILDALPVHEGYLSDTIYDIESEGILCNACTRALKAQLTAQRRDLWDRLPGFFRL